MKIGFVFAGAAAAALLTAQPVSAGATLSSDSLPDASVSVQPKVSLSDTSRVGTLRKGSRLGDAEGDISTFFTAWAANPIYIVGTFVFVGVAFDALNIIDFGLINKKIGPYMTVA